MTTADKVRALIEKSNKSQREFAKEAGIHYVTLNKCLSNDKFSMTSLKKIADYQGVALTSLMPDKRVRKVIEKTPVINGYIEYDGKIEAIRSVEDLERLWNCVSNNTNLISESAKTKEKTPTKKREQKPTKKEKPKYDIRCSEEGYAYFYQDVPLSNWWDSVPAIEYDGHTFNASESIFMYLKAKCFGDDETAAKIIEKDNKTYAQPKSRWDAVKKLGKKVKGFDFGKWARHREDAMYTALSQKALYDEEFKRVLLDPQYAGMTFCEASPHDKDWGIGLRKGEAMKIGYAGWLGKNLLGKALTNLRNELRPDLSKPPVKVEKSR